MRIDEGPRVRITLSIVAVAAAALFAAYRCRECCVVNFRIRRKSRVVAHVPVLERPRPILALTFFQDRLVIL